MRKYGTFKFKQNDEMLTKNIFQILVIRAMNLWAEDVVKIVCLNFISLEGSVCPPRVPSTEDLKLWRIVKKHVSQRC